MTDSLRCRQFCSFTHDCCFININFFLIKKTDDEKSLEYYAMRTSYVELVECIDPEKVLGEMFARELISFKEKLAIQGSKKASELMMDSVFRKWKKGTYEMFLHVLNEYGYESLATKLKGIVYLLYLCH